MKSKIYSSFTSIFLTLLISAGVCSADDTPTQPVCEAYKLRRQYSTIAVSSMPLDEFRLVESALVENGFTVDSVQRTFPDEVLVIFEKKDIDLKLRYEKGADRNIYNIRFDFTPSRLFSVSDILAEATELTLREVREKAPEGKTRLNMYTRSKCVRSTFPTKP